MTHFLYLSKTDFQFLNCYILNMLVEICALRQHWDLYILPLLELVLSRYSSFILQSKDMLVSLTDDSKFAIAKVSIDNLSRVQFQP